MSAIPTEGIAAVIEIDVVALALNADPATDV
jgi:hypothetical protein